MAGQRKSGVWRPLLFERHVFGSSAVRGNHVPVILRRMVIGVVPVLACVGFVFSISRPVPGAVVVRFERWEASSESPRFVISVHNETHRTVSVSEVSSNKTSARKVVEPSSLS